MLTDNEDQVLDASRLIFPGYLKYLKQSIFKPLKYLIYLQPIKFIENFLCHGLLINTPNISGNLLFNIYNFKIESL